MEAARIPWRPLGRLLVEQGLLTAGELEHALAQQEQTGRRLGETLVECGFVSGPELSNALAAQYGIELTAETGFGTGLRTEIQRRHETDRGRAIRAVPNLDDPTESESGLPEQGPSERETPSPDEQLLHAQLEEQWAKLAAAEERLAESHRELASLAREYDLRRDQAGRLAQHARRARARLSRQDERIRERDAQVERLAADVDGCDAEIERLRRESEELRHVAQRRRAQASRFLTRLRAPAPEAPPASLPDHHLLFVQLTGRYELVERPGPPPQRNTVLELPELTDDALVVTGLGRSPLPDDARPCSFAQPA